METLRAGNGLAFEVLPISYFNEGASSGRRIARAAFQLKVNARRHQLEVTLSADVDGLTYPEARAARRRGARAVVTAGVRVARAIAQGLQPLVVSVGQDPALARASWLHEDEFEGLPRRVSAIAEFCVERPCKTQLSAPPEIVEQVARSIRAVADGLHGALEDPAHRAIFGFR